MEWSTHQLWMQVNLSVFMTIGKLLSFPELHFLCKRKKRDYHSSYRVIVRIKGNNMCPVLSMGPDKF